MLLKDASLAILCGGKGSRLGGVDKGLLELEGVTFLEHLLRLRPLFADTLLVTSNAEPYARFGVRTVPDGWIGLGAPGALHTALCASTTPWTFVIAVDMPRMDAATVERLAAARSSEVDIVCAEGQPLGAFYRTALREPFGALLDGSATPSLRELVGTARVNSPASLDPRAFVNANTDDELRALGARRPSAC